MRKILGGHQADFAGRLSNQVDRPAELSRKTPDDSDWTEELIAPAAAGRVSKEDVWLPFDF